MRHKAFDPCPGHPAIHALVSLHAEIGGKIKDNKAGSERLANDLKAVEAVIRMFEMLRRINDRQFVESTALSFRL